MDRSKTNKMFCTKKMHEMRLADESFDMIVSGKKTVEVRLNDEKRRQISVGDVIIFCRRSEKSDTYAANVVGLRHYKNFFELFSAESPAATGFENTTVAQAAQSMYQYYTAEQESGFGALAIQIKPIEGSYDLCNRRYTRTA